MRISGARIAVAGLIALCGLLAAAPAGQARGGDEFAAIAIDKGTGFYGYGFDYPSEGAAKTRAIDECQARSPEDGCKVVVTVRNGCAAVAAKKRSDGSMGKVATGTGPTRSKAKHRALRPGDGKTKIVVSVCNS